MIISYHFPPIGLAGSVRWTKFSKYLSQFGYEPIILSVKPICYYFYDYDLLDEVAGVKVFRSESLDPARIFYQFLGKKRVSPDITRSSVQIHKLMFPDAKSGWVPFAYNLGCRVIRQERPDMLLATAPPYSSLLVGLLLKKLFKLPLVLEFRDPWPTSIFPPGGYQRMLLEALRRKLFTAADQIIAVSKEVKGDLGVDAQVISHGFDPDDYLGGTGDEGLVHIGVTYEYEPELEKFISIISKQSNVRFTLIGSTSPRIERLINTTSNCKFIGALSHKEVMSYLQKAEILVYFFARQGEYLTSKFYEYLGAGRPILAISGQEDQIQKSVGRFGVGWTVSLKAELITFAINKIHDLENRDQVGIEQYSFQNLTRRLIETINSIL